MKNRNLDRQRKILEVPDCVLGRETGAQERLRDIYDPEQGQPLQYTGKPESHNLH